MWIWFQKNFSFLTLWRVWMSLTWWMTSIRPFRSCPFSLSPTHEQIKLCCCSASQEWQLQFPWRAFNLCTVAGQEHICPLSQDGTLCRSSLICHSLGSFQEVPLDTEQFTAFSQAHLSAVIKACFFWAQLLIAVKALPPRSLWKPLTTAGRDHQ